MKFKFSLRSLMMVVLLIAIVLGGRTEYLRRMATYHDREADTARLLFAPDGYATSDEASFNTMMSHKKKAYDFRQAIYRPWTLIDQSKP